MTAIDNSRGRVTFGGEPCRAVLYEDNAGMLSLFILAGGGSVVYAAHYGYGEGVIDRATGRLAGELAAEDWTLLMQGHDPDREGWEGMDISDAEGLYGILTDSAECCVIADTDFAGGDDPLGLDFFCGGYGARAFLLAVTEGVPEYAGRRSELTDR